MIPINHIARRMFRALLPRRRHELLDGEQVAVSLDTQYSRTYAAVLERHESNPSDFLTHRYVEGLRWRNVLNHYTHGGRVLDVGAGNGAVELAFAASPSWHSFSIEAEWNDMFRELREASGGRVRRVVGDAAQLPFRANTFQTITLLETIEHVRDPERIALEAERVLDDDGLVMLTTPPRWRYAFRPDPHFAIRGLVVLPPAVQRSVAASRGYTRSDHYVDRIYSSTKQLARVFRAFVLREVLSRSRAPRRWFWDAVVFQKRKVAGV
jgi:SAM-dependent methyltransferase